MRRDLKINSKERERLEYQVDNESSDKYIAKVCLVILLYNDEETIEDIMSATDLSRRTIFNYIKRYQKNKNFMFDKINNDKKKRTNVSPLQKYYDVIVRDFNNNSIKTYKEAIKRIKELTGIKISENRLRVFFRKNDFIKDKNTGRYIQRKALSYLYSNADEIERFIYDLIQYDYDNKEIIERIKTKYPLITESDEEIKKFIKENTSI